MMIHSEVVKRSPRKKHVYPCAVCKKMYKYKRSLAYHMEQKHKGLGLPPVEVPGGEEMEEMEDMEQEDDGLLQVVKVPDGGDTGDRGDKVMPQVEKVPNVARAFEVEMLSCSICSKAFRLKSSLSSNKSREHRGDGLCCLVCDKVFSQTANLRCHMESHRAAPADMRRPAKDRRLHGVDVEGYNQTDRRRIFKMLVRDDPEALNEEDMINIIHDGNLSDRQMLKVLAVLPHCSGYIIKDVSSPGPIRPT